MPAILAAILAAMQVPVTAVDSDEAFLAESVACSTDAVDMAASAVAMVQLVDAMQVAVQLADATSLQKLR
jgi:hypothetical protein